MKTILATAALAIAIATPALAQEQWAYDAVRNDTYAQPAYDAYAQAPMGGYAAEQFGYAPAPMRSYAADRYARPHSPNPAWDVYDSLGYVGSDPDPFIRNYLARDGRSED